jgi:hypothetical protein
VSDLKTLHEERTKMVLKDVGELEMRIEAITREVTSSFNIAGRKLKSIAKFAAPSSTKLTTEENIRLNIQRSLAAKLQNLSAQFRKSQRAYLNEVNESTKGSSWEGIIGSEPTKDRPPGEEDEVRRKRGAFPTGGFLRLVFCRVTRTSRSQCLRLRPRQSRLVMRRSYRLPRAFRSSLIFSRS